MRILKRILTLTFALMLLAGTARAASLADNLKWLMEHATPTPASQFNFNRFNNVPTTTPAPAKLNIALTYTDYNSYPYKEKGSGQWYEGSNNTLKFHCKVYNHSWRTVKAFELYYYAKDVWGDKLYGSTIYYETTNREIKPDGNGWSEYVWLPRRKDIDRVYVGIKRVVYTDGTVEVVDDDDIDYRYWTITW